MILIIESIFLCALFTIMVFLISRNPIQNLYNYPPKIQEKVKQLEIYKDEIPTTKNKIVKKLTASIIFLIIISFTLRYINGCKTFIDAFINGYILWTVINLYDAVVLDIIWFCHDKHFIIKGTEDMIDEYHNYWFHIKGFFIGEFIALLVCFLSGLIINYIL